MKRSVALAFVILAIGVGAWVLSRAGSRAPADRAEPPPAAPARTPAPDRARDEERGVVLAKPRPVPQVEAEDEAEEGGAAAAGEDGAASTRSAMGADGDAPSYVPTPPLPPRPAGPGRIAGWIVDESGRPYEGEVTVSYEGSGGSFSTGGEDMAAFDLRDRGFETFVVKAATLDGRIALFEGKRGDAEQGIGDVVLRLERGATVRLSLEGARDRTRCALVTDGVHHADFTLRKDQPARVVVPPGVLWVRLYDGDEVHAERSIGLGVGEEEELVFTLDA